MPENVQDLPQPGELVEISRVWSQRHNVMCARARAPSAPCDCYVSLAQYVLRVMAPRAFVSRNPAERRAHFQKYFDDFLGRWIAEIIFTVDPRGEQEMILGELALSLARHAASTVLADPGRADDDAIVADAMAMAGDFIERLIHKLHARRGGDA